MKKKSSLERKISILIIIVTFFSLLTMGFMTRNLIYENSKNDLGKRALELSRFIASLDVVKSAYKSDNPTEILQPISESLQTKRLASFVVFLNMDGIRLTHPNTELIGLHFTGGDEINALNGKSYYSEAVGVSGPSIRGFTPIYDEKNVQVGVISIGMFKDNIDFLLSENQKLVFFAVFIGMFVGIIGAKLLAKNIKETMYGMEPRDIAELLQQRNTILNSVKEGIIFSDKYDRIALINSTAKKLLSIPNEAIGMNVEEVLPTTRMHIVRRNGIDEYNAQQKVNDVVIITNRKVVKVKDEIIGVVATFTEKEEVQRLAEELTNIKEYANGLRAKTHEFRNKLQTIHGLIELEEYEEAKRVISKTSIKEQTIITYLNERIKDPSTIGFLLGKFKEAEEKGIAIHLSKDSYFEKLPSNFSTDDMVLILGNLINNSIDAIQSSSVIKSKGTIKINIEDSADNLTITVEDNGPGLCLDKDKILERGVSSKEGNRGMGLFLINNQVTELNGGTFKICNLKNAPGAIAIVTIPKMED
ncbi:MAG: sensor histidine kinase [Sedimentibacter sp.]